MKYIHLFLALIICSASYASNYYVSTSGNDNNNGSSGSPFKTISKAAGVVNAGDVVLISGGTYSEKSITPKSSGTDGNYIVFKPNPGTGNVIVKHPATAQGDITPVFQLSNRSYIWIEGLQFKDFSFGLACIYISNGTGNVVTNNRFENLGNGEVGEWNGNQLVGIYNGVRNVVNNNYFDNIYGDGVNINSQSSEYNLVCHNTFKNFKGKLRSWGGSSTFSRAVDMQDMSNGNNVTAFNYAEKVVHHVWLDRDGSNNVILRNYGNGGTGNVFNESRCRSNVIQENIAVGMKAGYMTSYYTSTNWTLYPRWINNVAYNNTDGFVIHKSVGDEFRNNISYNNSDYNLELSKAAREQGPNLFSNNLWYSASKTNSILLNHIPQATTAVDIIDQNGNTKTLPAYSVTSGSAVSVPNFRTAVNETNGLSTDPKFVSATDLRLQSGSPAKGAGDNGLDLGAFAYYQNSNFGWNAALGTQDVSVYFTNTISSVNRGTETTFTLRLSKASSKIVSVNIVPVAGDAVEDLDVQLSSTTITFQAGETSKTVTVKTGNSAQHDELVAYRLENATNAVANGRIVRILRLKAGTAKPLTPSNSTQGPFKGITHLIPGRIEAEDYDVGGEGFAFHEADTLGNQGKSTYRNDGAVDVETTGDVDGLYNVGYILKDEWLEYTVEVTKSGLYDLDIRLAANGDGRTMHIEFDNVDVTGVIAVPNTAGWQAWQTFTLPKVNLTQGKHIMKIAFDANYMNFNYLEFKSVITGEERSKITEIDVFPNPFGAEGVSITAPEMFSYTISNSLGFVVEKGNGFNTLSIGKNLENGVYILTIESKGLSKTQKIIKK